jgi:protein-disulfide isomerase
MRTAKSISSSFSLPSNSLRRSLPLAISAFVLVAAVAFGLYLRHLIDDRNSAAAALTRPGKTKAAELPPSPGPPAMPGTGTRVTLEEFADFQCPTCGNYIHPSLLKAVRNATRVIS